MGNNIADLKKRNLIEFDKPLDIQKEWEQDFVA
jgi:hypothetical protein